MPEQLPFTAVLNHAFAGPVTALLRGLGIHVAYPQAPISNAVAMEILVAVLLILYFLVVRARLSADNPGTLQHLAELTEEFIAGQSHDIIGHGNEPFTAFLTVIFIFILICNLLGLVPGFEAPTANIGVPLGCAICAFIYYHAHGLKTQGPWKYAKHFAGPMPVLAPLMVPIEIISHLARLLSLTVRLFANMFAGDMVTLAFFALVPIGVPVVFLGLHVFVSLLQAYIFVLLAMVYLAGAVATEH